MPARPDEDRGFADGPVTEWSVTTAQLWENARATGDFAPLVEAGQITEQMRANLEKAWVPGGQGVG
ncbi:MAG: hypothetical protein OXG47_02540 [bacterium]|nr:hypothetical protein [bacterium]